MCLLNGWQLSAGLVLRCWWGFHDNHLSSLMRKMRMFVVGASSYLVLRAEAMAGEGPAVSVLGGVLCTMEPSAQQRELLHYFLHSPLVHSLSARQRIRNVFICVWKTQVTVVGTSCYLRICCEKLCFCSVVTRDEGNPGGCSASFSHTLSREKQCLFRLNSTSANWSMRLRGTPPPMPCRRQDGVDRLGEGSCPQ